MANWAALQEQLVGKPVFKRAKHGIHFQKGDQIEAHFVGKPCHHFADGIWKPIDTGLLATADGWYSSPHSDVVIHPDGRVRVKGSTYQQFTELPSAKTGKLVGDKIIREFPGGEQHLIMTENGFREEIHVFKPKFPVEKFIAKTYGTLPSHYKSHPITAEDAGGNTYTFTGDVKEFGVWLDRAVYPVVIDPDLTLQPDPTDGLDTFNYKAGVTLNFATDARLLTGNYGTSNVQTSRSFLKFNISSIPEGATISSATLSLYLLTGLTTSDRTHTIHRVTAEWAEAQLTWNNRLTGTAWTTAGGDYDATATDSIIVGAYSAWYSWDIQSDVEKWVAGIASNYGSAIVGDETAKGTRKQFNSSDYTIDTSLRPKLLVTYSSGGVPKHFMHYQRLRSL